MLTLFFFLENPDLVDKPEELKARLLDVVKQIKLNEREEEVNQQCKVLPDHLLFLSVESKGKTREELQLTYIQNAKNIKEIATSYKFFLANCIAAFARLDGILEDVMDIPPRAMNKALNDRLDALLTKVLTLKQTLELMQNHRIKLANLKTNEVFPNASTRGNEKEKK